MGEGTIAETLEEFSFLSKDAPRNSFFIINDKDETETFVPNFPESIHVPINVLVDKMANLDRKITGLVK